MNSNELFLNFLTRRGVLTSSRRDEVQKVLAQQKDSNIVEILVRGGFVNSEDLARQEAEFFNLEYTRLNKRIPDEVLSMVPFELARDSGAICFDINVRYLKVALVYPSTENLDKLRAWAKEKNMQVDYSICNLVDYEKSLACYLIKNESLKQTEITATKQASLKNHYDWSTLPLDKIVASILKASVQERAAEVLISCKQNVLIRFRQNGVLCEKAQLPRTIFIPLINYLKGLAHLPLSLKNKFVDGEFFAQVNNEQQRFFLKILSTESGEVISLKLFEGRGGRLGFDELNLHKHFQQSLSDSLTQKRGKIVLVANKGEGKTTLLNHILNYLGNDNQHVVSVGSEIQNDLPGVSRIQLRPEIGLSYEKVLPQLQRWSIDHLVLDELNDAQTAEHVMSAALTGTPVLTTVQGKSIIEGFQELLALGLELEHLLSVLNFLLAQKLVRRVCSHCAEATPLKVEDNRRILNILSTVPHEHWPRGLDMNTETLYAPRAVGCSWCENSGYSGKLPLHEGLPITDKLRVELGGVHKATELSKIVERYLAFNMLQDGLMKALLGKTTIEEVFSNCQEYNII